MESLGTGLIVLGVLGFLVSLVALVVALVRKKRKKPWVLSFIAFFILAIVGGGISPTTEPGKKTEKPSTIVKPEKPIQKEETKEKVLEVRVCPRDGINIRIDPGIDHEKDPRGQLKKGEELYIVQDEDGWIRFRFTEESSGWSGWVKKDLTVSKVQWESIKAEEEKEKIYKKTQTSTSYSRREVYDFVINYPIYGEKAKELGYTIGSVTDLLVGILRSEGQSVDVIEGWAEPTGKEGIWEVSYVVVADGVRSKCVYIADMNKKTVKPDNQIARDLFYGE